MFCVAAYKALSCSLQPVVSAPFSSLTSNGDWGVPRWEDSGDSLGRLTNTPLQYRRNHTIDSQCNVYLSQGNVSAFPVPFKSLLHKHRLFLGRMCFTIFLQTNLNGVNIDPCIIPLLVSPRWNSPLIIQLVKQWIESESFVPNLHWHEYSPRSVPSAGSETNVLVWRTVGWCSWCPVVCCRLITYLARKSLPNTILHCHLHNLALPHRVL